MADQRKKNDKRRKVGGRVLRRKELKQGKRKQKVGRKTEERKAEGV